MDESPIKVFLSYARKDDALREEFSAHLSSLTNQNLIEPWHDRKIDAGTEWAKEIDQNLEQAEIIVLLVSADSINSRYCYSNEMQQALVRHAAKTAQVIPVIIRTCDWQSSPLGVLQAIPRDGRRWTFWQYTERGRVTGVPTLVDRNVFNGSKEQFKQLLSSDLQ
jgi:TIR domain